MTDCNQNAKDKLHFGRSAYVAVEIRSFLANNRSYFGYREWQAQ